MTKISPDQGERPVSTALVVVYFGRWPIWFPAFQASCAANPQVTWLIFTDCKAPEGCPENIRCIPTTLDAVRSLATERLGMPVSLFGPRKLCDMKPTYGLLFEEHLVGFDFWGFCDIDVIWGRFSAFITERILSDFDVITTRKELIAGHLCLLRNTPDCRSLCLRHPDFPMVMSQEAYCWFDEKQFSDLVAQEVRAGRIRAYWPDYLVNYAFPSCDRPSILSWWDRYRWEDGALFSESEGGREILYLHFMNWKDSLKRCDLGTTRQVERFRIGYSAIVGTEESLPWSYRLRSRWQTFKKPQYYLIRLIRSFRRRRSHVEPHSASRV